MDLLQSQIGARAKEKRAAQHVMDADYFRRIDAMHYVLAHDDGQGTAGIAEADVCLVGVSRSRKTPTCFYLANRGIKAANVPIVPHATLPPELENPRCPVVGLTIETPALIEIRRHRLRLIGADGVRQDTTDYVDPESVKAEILRGTAALHRARLAGDRRHPPQHRGDGGDGPAIDGGLARPPRPARRPGRRPRPRT